MVGAWPQMRMLEFGLPFQPTANHGIVEVVYRVMDASGMNDLSDAFEAAMIMLSWPNRDFADLVRRL